jgi:hypothetical protein
LGIAVSCILSMRPNHRIRWLLINLTIFSPLIMCVDSRWQNSTHLHTNSTQNTENGTYITIKKTWEGWAVPRLYELYPGICLATGQKTRKNLS